MKGLLDTIRGRTRSPPNSSAGARESSDCQDADYHAALAASLVDTGPASRDGYPAQPAWTQNKGKHRAAASERESDPAGRRDAAAEASEEVSAGKPVRTVTTGSASGTREDGSTTDAASAASPADPTHSEGRDEATDIAAAIGASLDLEEANNGKAGGKNHVTDSRGAPPGFTGSNDSQDLAFFTDLPLVPPTRPPAFAPIAGWGGGGAGAYGGGSDLVNLGNGGQGMWKAPSVDGMGNSTRGGATGGGSGGAPFGQERIGWTGGAMFGSPGLPRRTPAHAASVDDDEALARRLQQEQWLPESSAGQGFGGRGLGGLIARAMGNYPSDRICAGCMLPITDPMFKQSALGSFHVCHERLPAQDGRIHFFRHNYFQYVYCPWHHDSTPRCCSCMRLEPMPLPGGGGEEPFAELSDKRMLCMACAQTAVVDSSEGAPAFQEVCSFFEQVLELPVPREMREVPVLVVDSPTLNEQTHLDDKHGAGVEQGMPTTRGLTLSEVTTVMHMAPGAMRFNPKQRRFEVGKRTRVNLGEQRAVTAILVLCGLPYASFSAILAHEAMHAWMKLEPSMPCGLPAQVEEGICQLISLLWLQHLAGRSSEEEGGERGARAQGHASPPSNEELRGFFVHQIKTDVSTVYGDGFRKAKAVYDAVGLEAILNHVKRYQSFPTV